MKNHKIKMLAVVMLTLLTFLASCSCGKQKAATLFEASGRSANELVEWVNEQLKVSPNKTTYDAIALEIANKEARLKELTEKEEPLTPEEVTEKNNLPAEIQSKKIDLESENQKVQEETKKLKIKAAKNLIYSFAIEEGMVSKKKYQYRYDIIMNYDAVKYAGTQSVVEVGEGTEYAYTTDGIVDKAQSLKDADPETPYLKEAVNYTRNCISASNSAATAAISKMESEETDFTDISINEVVCVFALRVNERKSVEYSDPIVFYGSSAKDFFGHLFNNLLVFPIAWLIVAISKLFGGYYIIGLLIATLLVRTAAWPVYAKTNDMSIKMQLMQPELTKIQEKYANKQDERSKQMMQVETAQLYKKYKVGLGGCLMPFVQFPIFMAIYRAVSRIPYTVSYNYEGSIYTNNWANELKSKFLGIDLFADRTASTAQLIGIIVLVVIVVGTQFLSQWLSQRRQKKNQQESQADIPAYRRQSYEQTKNSSQSSMKLMMYMMMLMMGLFVFTSKAGLGIYWCIGNVYSIFQMELNNKTSAKRMEALKKKL